MDLRVQRYLHDGLYQDVVGACDGETLHRVHQFNQLQTDKDVHGDLVEIGVYHGRLFLLLALMARSGETALAVDVFEKELNFDPTGGVTTFKIVQDNFKKFVGEKEIFNYISTDSIYLNSEVLRNKLPSGFVRLFSIDGAHSHFHTVHDMKLAGSVLAPGGIVLVDDITNTGWPGVMEGVARYFLLSSEKRLFPFMMSLNKLWLTTYDYHKLYMDFAWNHVSINEAIGLRKRITNFFGSDMVGC